ncbi:NAD(P)H-hydrate epimerase [Candidatus Omnitrophota bacterium]
MKIITTEQAKAVDLRASRELGINTLMMMENAGIRVTDFLLEVLANEPNKTVAVFCGKGNNAGDGLVVSRQLICEGMAVDTFLLAPEYSFTTAARQNLSILKKITKRLRRIKTDKDLEAINFSSYSLLVDAILGIGLKGETGGIFRATIERMNSSHKKIVSIDVPSGLDANQGCVLGAAIKATYTVTLIAPKKGLLIKQGPHFTGRLITRHIGFPC